MKMIEDNQTSNILPESLLSIEALGRVSLPLYEDAVT